MENTRFVRDYINLLKYDKPNNSLPILLVSTNVFVMLINCFTAIRVEKGVEKFLLAASRFVSNCILQFNIFNHSFNPGGVMKLLELIEDDSLVIKMENTRFLRDYINLLKYDKPNNSLPILLVSTNVFVMLINCFTAIKVEKDVEKFLLAASRFVTNCILQFNIFNHSFNPGGVMKLLELIEDDSLVRQHDFMDRKDKWTKFEIFYEKKRKSLKVKCRYLIIIMTMACISIVIERPINLILSKKEIRIESGDWPTPHVSYTPAGLESWSFFCYLFSSQVLAVIGFCMEGYLMECCIWMPTEKLIADFETIYILLDDLAVDFPVKNENLKEPTNSKIVPITKIETLKADMRRVIACHQKISRNFRVCADNATFTIITVTSMIVIEACFNAYRTLQSNTLKEAVNFAILFVLVNLLLLFIFNNGQRLSNQNDILRRYLTELPWIDKPRWFRQAVHMMMIRANVDIQLKPYGIFVLDLMSFKEVIKFITSAANVFYTIKQTSKT
ncbi:hypothetical protein LSTR_LSTR001929 [Laodelphax striatellus]|uniref:Odorant receptor n=1 Tax=Laodelphax striatellus TaxID=195883 RepID=A0A482XI05_LAOST|nr:hypothetical protein LSTR_LSTR001929 [Laodelphax striatellus]